MSPTSAKTAPVALVVLTATMIGTSFGLFIADRDAFLFIGKYLTSRLATVRGYLFAGADTPSAKPPAPTVIPTGLISISAIHYTSNPASTHLAFDLQPTDLVRTGKLRNPDRIYFDLQERSRQQATLEQSKTQKTVSIAGNLLTGVRISQRKQGATRIVLDLKQSCDFTYQTSLGPPSRLTVEIRPRATGAAASNVQRSDS